MLFALEALLCQASHTNEPLWAPCPAAESPGIKLGTAGWWGETWSVSRLMECSRPYHTPTWVDVFADAGLQGSFRDLEKPFSKPRHHDHRAAAEHTSWLTGAKCQGGLVAWLCCDRLDEALLVLLILSWTWGSFPLASNQTNIMSVNFDDGRAS